MKRYIEPGLQKLKQPASLAASKWRENEKMKRKRRENEEMERKCRKNEEMERDSLSTCFQFSSYFLPLYPFPISKIVSFCRKMLNTTPLLRMSQKT